MRPAQPMSIPELEAGLRALSRKDLDRVGFWDRNIVSFRQTLLFAIRDTADALLSPNMTPRWQAELQGQLRALVCYLKFADRYIARRLTAPGPSACTH